MDYNKKALPLSNKNGNSTGFTLLELLTSIFIIMLLSVIFVIDYKNISQKNEVSISAQKLISDARLAQNQALGLVKFGSSPATPKGWGVYIDTANNDQYIIFADLNSNNIYDNLEESKIIILTKGITISPPGAVSRYDILFIPPNPDTVITQDLFTPVTSATIKLTDGVNAKDVIVNSFGLVEAQ
ncbi:hypothetical protein COZ73_01605 [Candidatus Falkowbacteria bacterium CG_4_8_14_3_um_filter_36_11]|nr:MAG: hypothetical protein COZ73_01605 [Candidatus Falkowbacteria bacterium CG_4_8_14_3_um_filter_36_11]